MIRTSSLMKILDVNTTSAALTVFGPTLTEPVGVNPGEASLGIFNLVPGGRGLVPDWIWVSFFGAGSDNNTFDVRITGWERLGSTINAIEWLPAPLATFTCTVCTQVGVAGGQVAATDRIVDTIVTHATLAPQPYIPDRSLDSTNALAATFRGVVTISSPANEFRAWALVPTFGCEKIQFDFAKGTATNCNGLMRMIREEP